MYGKVIHLKITLIIVNKRTIIDFDRAAWLYFGAVLIRTVFLEQMSDIIGGPYDAGFNTYTQRTAGDFYNTRTAFLYYADAIRYISLNRSKCLIVWERVRYNITP